MLRHTEGGGGGVSRCVTKCHMGKGGLKWSKKVSLLFEWPLILMTKVWNNQFCFLQGIFCFQRLRISKSSCGGSKGTFDKNNSFGRRHRHDHRHLPLHLGKLGLKFNQPLLALNKFNHCCQDWIETLVGPRHFLKIVEEIF